MAAKRPCPRCGQRVDVIVVPGKEPFYKVHNRKDGSRCL